MTVCTECVKCCPLHNVRYCPTCHKHDNECDFGACEAPALWALKLHDETGRHTETRKCCNNHRTWIALSASGPVVADVDFFAFRERQAARLASLSDRWFAKADRTEQSNFGPIDYQLARARAFRAAALVATPL